MQLVNLTPHVVRIFGQDGETLLAEIFPSGEVARCSVTSTEVGRVGDVPLFAAVFGQVDGLPEPRPETIFIVSMLVRSALPNRVDLASPGELIRDASGQPIGCKGLNVNR